MSKLKAKTSKNTRTVAEIQQEYGQVCAQIGENTFRMKETEKVNNVLSGRIRELGEEMARATAKAQEEAKAKADAASKEEAK